MYMCGVCITWRVCCSIQIHATLKRTLVLQYGGELTHGVFHLQMILTLVPEGHEQIENSFFFFFCLSSIMHAKDAPCRITNSISPHPTFSQHHDGRRLNLLHVWFENWIRMYTESVVQNAYPSTILVWTWPTNLGKISPWWQTRTKRMLESTIRCSYLTETALQELDYWTCVVSSPIKLGQVARRFIIWPCAW